MLFVLQVLAKIRSELQSISHERVIMDVLTRPTINETKRIHAIAQQGASNQPKRFSSGIAGNSTRNNPATKNGAIEPSRVAVHGDSTVVISNSRQQSGSVATNVSYKDTAELLTTPIHIPQYSPTIASVQSARRSGARQQAQSEYYTNTIELAVQQGGDPSLKDRHSRNTNYTTQVITNNSTMPMCSVDHYRIAIHSLCVQVPNLRRGSIAPEVANLQSQPIDPVSAAEMERNFRKRCVIWSYDVVSINICCCSD